jgi:NADH-quinone oxidoreductase subunit F
VQKFKAEFEQHIAEHRCPYGDKPWGSTGEFQ